MMTATYQILEIEEGKPVGKTSETQAPVLTVVADTGNLHKDTEDVPEGRDWDPYNVWKRMIRKESDQG